MGASGRAKARFPPWPGRAQAPLAHIRARLVGRARRLQEIGIQPQDAGRHLLEDVGELVLMGYPPRFVMGVMFSLPATLECAGHLQRTFLRLLRRGLFRRDAGSRPSRLTPSRPPPPLSLKGREIGVQRGPRPPPPAIGAMAGGALKGSAGAKWGGRQDPRKRGKDGPGQGQGQEQRP